MKISLPEDTGYSGEINPIRRETASPDTVDIFGKKIKKKNLFEVLQKLSGGVGGEEQSSSGLEGGFSARGRGASAPMYDPNRYYGGMFSMYGGPKVRGGLLGE